eukprot:TRINITY_DN1608_c0_g1_i2.p1 TRINITY_DN1608_c0_g1~~TRINITY_DN1608_c0_g1_i2.p1  ORF type:complete len:595 (+),score=51.72 TRINITY_DN1608_c0_g1_i2:90-1874(+)
MLSLTVAQRAVARQPSLVRYMVAQPRSWKRANTPQIRCFQDAVEVQEVVDKEAVAQVQVEEDEQQVVTTEISAESTVVENSDSGLSHLFQDEHDLDKFQSLLIEHQHHMDPTSIAVAAGTLRKAIKEHRNNLRAKKEVKTSLESFKVCCNTLTKVVRENLESLTFIGASNSIWCLSTAKNYLQIHTEIENFDYVMEDLFVHAAKLVVEEQQHKFPRLQLARVLGILVGNLNENNRKHFDVLYNRFLTLGLTRLDPRECVDLIRVFDKVESSLEVLDQYIPKMFKMHLRDRNQDLICVLCPLTAQMRYYDEGAFAKMQNYLKSRPRLVNGAAMIGIAQFVAALATKSDGREELVSNIVRVSIQRSKRFWKSDFIKILYYTAHARCPEQDYKKLVSICLERIGEDFSELSDDELRMLRQVQLLQRSYGVSIELPQELQTLCTNAQAAYIGAVVHDIQQDFSTSEIFSTIQQNNQDAECGVTAMDGEIAVPILVQNEGQKVALQPVKTEDFVLNVPGRLLESKKAEYTILKNLGYQVQIVQSQKWQEDSSYADQVLSELSQRLNGEFVEEQEEASVENIPEAETAQENEDVEQGVAV